MATEGKPDQRRALIVIQLGKTLLRQERMDKAKKLFGDLLSLVDRHGPTVLGANCHYHLGEVALWQRDLDEAAKHHEQALTIRRQHGQARAIGASLGPQGPLRFKDSKRYRDRLSDYQKRTGEKDALVVMAGELKSMPIVAAAFEFEFMGGSMGSVVGERFVRGIARAIEDRRPVVCFAASGGAE